MQYRIRDLYWEMRLQTGSRYDKIGFNQKLKGDGMMESYMQMLAKRSKMQQEVLRSLAQRIRTGDCLQ